MLKDRCLFFYAVFAGGGGFNLFVCVCVGGYGSGGFSGSGADDHELFFLYSLILMCTSKARHAAWLV